ncbi:hypothetical protein NDU88_005961 [Pleurodeles waltl]|uniref:Uncharacterized protein n=1 Tax=Pleurodeles waltl TaxID=8319 RepID=A0AAV7MXT4_PLEWA|nr:hypothetical protein NDU88_005961 [Pleurodeles waltl]
MRALASVMEASPSPATADQEEASIKDREQGMLANLEENERLAKVQQKLGLWSLRKLSIEGKALVLRNDALPMLQYVTQAWPLLANVARAINSMVFHSVWHSKTDRVKTSVMNKEHRKGGKTVPDISTILRAFFVCGCDRITMLNENKDHSAYRVFCFFLLPVWRRLGRDKWENATMLNWDLP